MRSPQGARRRAPLLIAVAYGTLAGVGLARALRHAPLVPPPPHLASH